MYIVVLGGGIDLSGHLPPHVYQRLDEAIRLYQRHPESKIVASGKYSFLYRNLKQKPLTTEAEKMAEYLIQKGVPKDKILLEKKSKDTIGNAYYLKKNIFISKKETQATIITSYFHLKRVKYIFKKIFGAGYRIKFIGAQADLQKDGMKKVIKRQKELLEKTREILSAMKHGDHHFLKGKLYKIKYYREKRPDWVINFLKS